MLRVGALTEISDELVDEEGDRQNFLPTDQADAESYRYM